MFANASMRHLYFISFLIVVGCAPYVPIQFKNDSSPTVSSIKSNDLEFYLEQINNQYEHKVFDLEVVNDSDESISIAPEAIRVYTSSKKFPTLHTRLLDSAGFKSYRLYTRSAGFIKNLFRQKVKDREAAQAFFSVLAVGLMVYDQVNDSRESHKRYLTKAEVNNSIKRDAFVTAGIVASNIADASLAKAAENEYYLPYELFDGDSIQSLTKKRGKIFFPMINAMRFLRIVIPVADQEYVFDLKRKGIK